MIDTILKSVTGVVGEFIEDKDKKNEIEAKLTQSLISLDLAQAQANIESAKSSSIFVAGARPAIMWVCCLGLLTNFFILHHLKFVNHFFRIPFNCTNNSFNYLTIFIKNI